jgi:hypothetical protein
MLLVACVTFIVAQVQERSCGAQLTQDGMGAVHSNAALSFNSHDRKVHAFVSRVPCSVAHRLEMHALSRSHAKGTFCSLYPPNA